jgi:hypothetical protein
MKMPIYKVTVKEKVTRYTTAYIEVSDQGEADAWAGEARATVSRTENDANND